jgi:hypothetical protein
MLFVNLFRGLTIEDIQKYNGISVKMEELSSSLFNSSNVLVLFKFTPISASKESKLRGQLSRYFVTLRKIKKRDLKVFLKLFHFFNLHKTMFDAQFIDGFFRVLGGNMYVVVLRDFDHFLFFQRFFLSNLVKLKFTPLSIKYGNQYFLVNSLYFKNLNSYLVDRKYDLFRIKSFFFFQLCVVSNFLSFFLLFKFQISVYNCL